VKIKSLALSLLFWVASLALVLWVVRCPPEQLIFSSSLCILTPLAAMVLPTFSGGHIVISGQKSESRPDAIALLLLPSLGLSIRALGPAHVIDSQIALTYAAGIAVAWSVLSYYVGTYFVGDSIPTLGKLFTFAILFFVGLSYGYGTVFFTDTIADRVTSKITEVTVLKKYIGAGKGHTPYLVLGPTVAQSEESDESVSLEVYEGAVVGQKICRVEHPGSIGLKWYEILSCESSLQA
jgi:hypothetical protein